MAPPEVYISYAWRDREQAPTPDDRESIVDELCARLTEQNCTVRRDKTQITYKQSIGDFMRHLGAANQVVTVVSDRYLRSKFCMYEAIEILNHRHLEVRLFPLVLNDAKIHNAKSALAYVAFWEKEVEDMETALAGVKNETAKFRYQEDLRELKQIAEKIQDFIVWIADKNTLSGEIHLATGFEQLLGLLLPPDNSEAVTGSHRLTTPALPEPVFPKLNVLDYSFAHALRPAQTKSIVARLPTALNVVAGKGQGCIRLLKDLEKAGLYQTVYPIRIRLSVYLKNYTTFLEAIAQQGKVSSGADLFELLHSIAVQHQQPVLFILENLDDMYVGGPQMDRRFDISFLQKLNALKNASFVCPLVGSYQVIKGISFQGQSSPFAPETVFVNSLSYDDLYQEIVRCLPDLPEPLARFIAEQLEFEPHQTYDLLDDLIQQLDGRSTISRDFIGHALKDLRLKYGRV